MTALAGELSRIAGQAFAAEGLAESFGHVQLSDRPDLAPFPRSAPAVSNPHGLGADTQQLVQAQ